MRASLSFRVVAVCFILSSSCIWAVNADWGEWSPWSGCDQNRLCQNNDVIKTSNRSRLCKMPKGDSSIDWQDCEGPRIETRACDGRGNCSEEAAPIQNKDNRVIEGDQMVSLLMGAQGLHEYSNSTSNEVKNRRSCATNQQLVKNSCQTRAADPLSFLEMQPAKSHAGGSKQSGIDHNDVLQFLNMMDKNKLSGNEVGHSSQDLKSFMDFAKKISKDDIKYQENDELKDLLQLGGPTMAGKEKTTVAKTTSPLINVPYGTTTQISTAATTDNEEKGFPSVQIKKKQNTQVPTKTEGVPNANEDVKSERLLKLINRTMKDIRELPDKVEPRHLEKIADFVGTLQETMDDEKLSENINYLNEMLKLGGQPSKGSPTEAGASLNTPTAPVLTVLYGEDLIRLLNRVGPTQEGNMQDAGPMLDEMSTISSNEVSREVLDQLNELLDIVKEEETPKTTEAAAPTEASISNLIADVAYLLEVLNKTERTNQSHLQDEFKDDLVILNNFIDTKTGKPDVAIKFVFDNLSDLLNERTTINTTMYSEILPTATAAGSTQAEGAELLDMIENIEETKKKHDEESHLQAQHTEDLFSVVREPNNDALSHEIKYLNQLPNPSSAPRVIMKPNFVTISGEATTVPSTMDAKENMLDLVDEIAGQQLIGLLSQSTVATTDEKTPTTVAYERSNKGEGEEPLLDMIKEIKETEKKQGENDRLQVQGLEKLYDEVKESNKDMLDHEINHLNQLLNPTAVPTEATYLSLQKLSGTATAGPSTAVAKETVLDFVEEITRRKRDEQSKSQEEMDGINGILEEVSGENILINEVHQLLGLIAPSTFGSTTLQTPASASYGTHASKTLPASATAVYEKSTMREGEDALLDMIEEFKGTEKKQKEKDRLQVQGLEKLYDDVKESNKDMLDHEINHLNQLLNPTTVPTESTGLSLQKVSVYTATAAPSTVATNEKIMEFVEEIAGLTGDEQLKSQEEMSGINDILKKVKESDKYVLEDDVYKLLGLLVPSTLESQTSQTSATATYNTPAFNTLPASSFVENFTIALTTEEFETTPSVVAKEDVLDLLDEITVLTGKDKVKSRQEVQDIWDVFERVHEPDEDVLFDEIKHLKNIFMHVTASSTASEAVTSEKNYISTKTYQPKTRPNKLILQPTIAGKYVLDFLHKVKKTSQDRSKSDFEDDVDIADQSLKTNTRQVGNDLGETISQVGALLSKNISTKVPVILGVETISPIVKESQQPSSISPLPSTATVAVKLPTLSVSPEPENQPLLDLIETLGKNKSEVNEENRHEVQKLEGILFEETKPHEDILSDELDRLNKVLNPEKYTTKTTLLHPLAASASPWQRKGQSVPSMLTKGSPVKLTTPTMPEATSPLEEPMTPHQTPFAEEKLLELFAEVPDVAGSELQENKTGMEVIKDIIKGANKSGKDVFNDEVNELITMLLPEEAAGAVLELLHTTTSPSRTALGPPTFTEKKTGVTEKGETLVTTGAVFPRLPVKTSSPRQGIKKSTRTKASEVSALTDLSEIKENKVLLDILSGPSLSDYNLVKDAAGMQDIAELFANLTQTDEKELINEIAQLNHGLRQGVENTLAYQISTEPILTERQLSTNQLTTEVLEGKIAQIDHGFHHGAETIPANQISTEPVSTKQKLSTNLQFTTEASEGKIHGIFPPTKTKQTSTGKGNDEDFLDTLLQLRAQMNDSIDWEYVAGVLFKEQLDRDDQEELKEGLEFFWNMLKEARAKSSTTIPTYSVNTKEITTITSKPTTTSTPTATERKTSTSVSPQVATQTVEEIFLGTLRDLVARVNLNLPWAEIKQVGAISANLDKDAKKEVRDELIYVADIMNEVGKMENGTVWTTHAQSAATMATSTKSNLKTTTTVTKETTTEMSTPPPPSTPYSPVDRWTEWSPWGACSSTCGLGEQSRSRECRLFIEGMIIPAGSCEGSRAETMVCKTRRCPEMPRVDGQWSGWSEWTECSAMCGPGNQTRYRLCDSPQPAGGDGLPCEGAVTDDRDCFGEAEVCEAAGVKAPVTTTARSKVVKPTRQRANKAVAVIFLVVFIVVVVLAFAACFAAKLRRVYGKKRYRAGEPTFEKDTLLTALRHTP